MLAAWALQHQAGARRRLGTGVERVLCAAADQNLVRTILARHINSHSKMTLQGLATQDADTVGLIAIEAYIYSLERNDKAMEDLVSRLHIEPSVRSVSWEKRS